MRRLKIFTWHIHGSYLYYLSQIPHDIYIPFTSERGLGYYGKTQGYPWPSNVFEIPAENVRKTQFDCVIYQHRRNWTADRESVLNPEQQCGPQIYIEHDPPRESPTDTKHVVDDPRVLLVHVTAFNSLMWDSNRTRTRVIEHGVVVPPQVAYSGELSRGCVVINNIRSRGRRLGFDIFLDAKRRFPLDLVGMGWQEVGGIGEVRHAELFAFMSRYRFFFNPIRYTSLGLAVCEAMAVGCPIVGLATTEMSTVIKNGINGYVETDIRKLYKHMERLLVDRDEAAALSQGARIMARERFSIERFVSEWNEALCDVVGHQPLSAHSSYTPSTVSGCEC